MTDDALIIHLPIPARFCWKCGHEMQRDEQRWPALKGRTPCTMLMETCSNEACDVLKTTRAIVSLYDDGTQRWHEGTKYSTDRQIPPGAMGRARATDW